MSLISPLDRDLAVVYPPLLPVRLAELLAERGIELIPVPDEEFGSMGSNVLALAPRRALALDGNPVTRRRMERAGVDVVGLHGRGAVAQGRRRADLPHPAASSRIASRYARSRGRHR